MKLKNLSIILFPLIILSTVFFSSCDDSGVTTPPPGSNNPDIQFKPGAVYYFRNDSISQNGTYRQTAWLTKDSILPMTNYNGKDCYPVNSVTRDTILNQIIRSTTDYYSYTKTEGKFYQYGARRIIDPNQTATWDLLADFTQPTGTEVSLYTITNLFGQSTLSANVRSKVAADTLAPLVPVNCFRVTVRAEVLVSGFPVGNVYIDYYIGYASMATNPSGRVGTKIYPINLTVLVADGADQRLTRFRIP